MAEITLSEAEKVFILHGVKDNLRNDGRGCRDYRTMEVETDVVSNTNGSARVRLANSDILVGVKAEIEVPSPKKPDEGRLVFFVDCSANATPEFEGRGGEELAAEVINALTRAYSNKKSLDLSEFGIIPSQSCWVFYVDVLILECGGNLFDAISFAIKSALFNTKIPAVTVVTEENQTEFEIADDPYDCTRFDVTGSPVFVTLAQIGHHFVVDPTQEEEACGRASVVMAVSKEESFNFTQKIGGGSIHPETLYHMLETGSQLGEKINKQLMAKLIEEESLGKSKKKRGFLS